MFSNNKRKSTGLQFLSSFDFFTNGIYIVITHSARLVLKMYTDVLSHE